MIDTALVFTLFVLPVLLLALIRPMGRLAFFLLGLLLFLVIEFVRSGSAPTLRSPSSSWSARSSPSPR